MGPVTTKTPLGGPLELHILQETHSKVTMLPCLREEGGARYPVVLRGGGERRK